MGYLAEYVLSNYFTTLGMIKISGTTNDGRQQYTLKVPAPVTVSVP